MGNWLSVVESPPPSVVEPKPTSVVEPLPSPVVKPPLVDFPPLAARTRMIESAYKLMYGKLALRCLFEDYFEEARHFSTRIVMPIDGRHVNLIASFSGPLHHIQENIVGNAQLRWQSDVDDPHTFVDLFVSNKKPALLMRSCAYFPNYGIGAFGIFPIQRRISSGDYGVMGLRYDSSNVSFGATVIPFSGGDEVPKNAWLVGKIGKLTAGVQYEPKFGNKDGARYKNLANWSCAVGYEFGSPLNPLFSFGLELARDSQIIASFYQHLMVQRQVSPERRIKNPLEEDEIVGYIDLGIELQTSSDDDKKSSNNLHDTTFQLAASWQANKNVLIKGKMGLLSSSLALAFKSWWSPSFISISAVRDHIRAETAFGFGIHLIDNIHEASYQRVDPNFVMLTPNKDKEHISS